MKKSLVIHPFLFALYPALELFYKLSSMAHFSDTWRVLVLLLVFTTLVFIGLGLWWRDWGRAGFMTTLLLFGFVYYGSIQLSLWRYVVGGVRLGRHELFLPIWLLLLIAVGSIWRRLHMSELVTKSLNIVALVAVLVSGSRYAVLAFTKSSEVPAVIEKAEHVEGDIELDYNNRPDIYYIILDGYGRQDVLQALYAFDNSAFLQALEQRGFYVASDSRTNYVQTLLSLASSLNFQYLDPQTVDVENRSPLVELIRDSTVLSSLNGAGYQLVALQNSYHLADYLEADVVVAPEITGTLNYYEEMFLQQTLASVLFSKGYLKAEVTGYDYHRNLLLYGLETLPEISALASPKFVLYHIIAPHPPFVLDREGKAVIPDAPFWGLSDGDHFIGGAEAYYSGYREVLPYLNQVVLQAIDEILANSVEPPIIILQADHGPGSMLNWESPELTCHWERVSILNAYYLPGDTIESLYPSITPVNTFRLIFDRYFGTTFGLLEDRSYYSRWNAPYDFIDVTEVSRQPCTLP